MNDKMIEKIRQLEERIKSLEIEVSTNGEYFDVAVIVLEAIIKNHPDKAALKACMVAGIKAMNEDRRRPANNKKLHEMRPQDPFFSFDHFAQSWLGLLDNELAAQSDAS